MVRYRVTTTIVYEMESELSQNEVTKIAENEISKFERTILRKDIKLEPLRERQCNIRLGFFTPEDVLPFISRSESSKRDYIVGDKTYTVKMNSQRYFVFRENLCCVACGLKGTKMILEHNPSDKSPHFNLYGEEKGNLILFTKDHVNPKAFGGENRHSNYQTMCAVCNSLKGHTKLTLQSLAELRRLYDENRSIPRKKLSALIDETKTKLAVPYIFAKDKTLRKKLQTQLKFKESLIVNVDVHIWRTVEGTLIGRSVYERELPGAVLIASIKESTELMPVLFEESRVLIKFSDVENFSIYQGYLDYKESQEFEYVNIDQQVS